MRSRAPGLQLQFIADADRLLSPVVMAVFLPPLYVLEWAAWHGEAELAATGLTTLALLLGSVSFFELDWVRRLDERLAESSLSFGWVDLKRRRREWLRRWIPHLRRVSLAIGSTYVACVLPAMAEASLGLPLPNLYAGGFMPPAGGWLLFQVHSYLALASLGVTWWTLALDRAWRGAQPSALHATPVVTAAEVVRRWRSGSFAAAAVVLGLLTLLVELLARL